MLVRDMMVADLVSLSPPTSVPCGRSWQSSIRRRVQRTPPGNAAGERRRASGVGKGESGGGRHTNCNGRSSMKHPIVIAIAFAAIAAPVWAADMAAQLNAAELTRIQSG